jgi:hypothetical protein
MKLGVAIAMQVVDDAFLRMIRDEVDRAWRARDPAGLCRTVHELVEGRQLAARAIDTKLSE